MYNLIIALTLEQLTVSSFPVIDDFELYLTFLKARPKIPVTTGNNHLKRNDLARLNQEMHFKTPWAHEKSMQPKYLLLHFFYHVVIRSGLARIHHEKQVPDLRINPAVLEQYEQLAPTEKYFFLLETAWCRIDYEELTENRSLYFLPGIIELLQLLSKLEPGQQIIVENQKLVLPDQKNSVQLWFNNSMYYVFWYLGLYDLEPDAALTKAPDIYTFPFSGFRVTAAGKELLPVLLDKRPFALWNEPGGDELQFGFTAGMLLSDQEEEVELKEEDEDKVDVSNRQDEAFLEAFKFLAMPGELEHTIYVNQEQKSVKGTYTIKVSLTKKIYRTIAIGASGTYEKLHLAIQDAYKFDDDHLYSFFMDGKRWSKNAIHDPYGDQPPFADEVTLGESGLYEGMHLLYLFDFGDQWEFDLQVLKFDSSLPEPKKATVVDEKGEAPAQYWFEEDDEEM